MSIVFLQINEAAIIDSMDNCRVTIVGYDE